MHIRITRSKLSLEEAYGAVSAEGCGAVVLFSGTVRPDEQGRRIAAIEYEAYESMALKELTKLVRSAEERFGAAVAVLHRIGLVRATEASILVAASAAHRAEAFAACREVLEQLKRLVPIWKAAFVLGPLVETR